MVGGATCSMAEPCWVAAGAELLGVQAEDGDRLLSVRSGHLLKRCSKPLSNHNHPRLVSAGMLDALWRMDPDSYFYAHVQEGKLRALPPELSVDPALRIPAGAGAVTVGWLPNGVTRGGLVLVWRRSGLRLLCGGVAHALEAQLGTLDVAETGAVTTWHGLDVGVHAGVRRAVEAALTAAWLAIFDARLPNPNPNPGRQP